jgi:hypothetical protein
MKSHGFGLVLLSVIAIVASAPAQAVGTLTRTFVSSAGSDANPCTITQPCATFAIAYAAVQTNGIVAALDPGKYGPLTITGPVTINGNGWAAITGPASSNAITINAGSGTVALMGLEIDGAGLADIGILFNTGSVLEVTNCIVRNFTGSGLTFAPSSSATFKVTNSEFADDGGQGIVVSPSATPQIAGVVDHVGFYNNFIGLNLLASGTTGGTISVTANDSIASNNTNNPPNNGSGFAAQAAAGQAVTHLMLVKSVAANNYYGLVASGQNAVIFVNDSTITKNTTGWLATSSGVIKTFGNNAVIDDTNGDTDAETPVSLK